MRVFRLLVLTSAISLVWTPPASAMSCQTWDRLTPAQKPSVVEGMIRDALASQRGRSYELKRGAIGRCMYGRARSIEYDFDDACATTRTSGMQALNNIFKNYIWTCVN